MAWDEDAQPIVRAEAPRCTGCPGTTGERRELPVGHDLAARNRAECIREGALKLGAVVEVQLDVVERDSLACEVRAEAHHERIVALGRSTKSRQLAHDDAPFVQQQLADAPTVDGVRDALHAGILPARVVSSGHVQFERVAPWAGVGFVVLLAAARLLTTKGPCGSSCFARTSDAEVVSFYTDSGNRWRIAIASVLFALALFLFLWFVARLGAGVILVAGGVYVALQAAGTAVYVAVATGPGLVTSEEHYQIDAAVVRAAGDASWTLRSFGSVAAAALVFATAAAYKRRLRNVGYALGAMTLFFAVQEGTLDRGVAITLGVQDLTFLIWVLILAVSVLRRGDRLP